MAEEGIDFVIAWVDGSDARWLAQAQKFIPRSEDENTSPIRYRDWGTLRYWFRGVERFAPWVRRIHFITWGHLPSWLNVSAPKLNIVKHADYIPERYLPTFSSRTIELNIHRIEGLSERFVYFNDDMFLLDKVKEERFFKGGLPRDMARLSLLSISSISHAILNMVEIINRRYTLHEVLKSHPCKWFSPRYGLVNLLKTLDLAVWGTIPALSDTHMPQPYLKSTFQSMWQQETAALDATCLSKVRDDKGLNQWIMRYEQLLSGHFSPVGFKDCRLDALHDSRLEDIVRYIEQQKYAMICLNDSEKIASFENSRQKLCTAFDKILPQKSCYEL